jgi:hypothetical protein
MNKLFVALLFYPIFLFGQVEIKNIEADFLDFRKLYENRQFDEALNYFSDFHFETIDREEILKSYQERPEIKTPLITKYTLIDSIVGPIKMNNIYYSLLSYSRVIVNNADKNINSNELKKKIEVLKKVLGEENTIYIKESNAISFKSKYFAYAILKPDELHWKFIFFDKENHQLVNAIIPNKLTIKDISN